MKVNSGVQHQATRTESRDNMKDDSESVTKSLLERLTSLEKQMKQVNRRRRFYPNTTTENQPNQQRTQESTEKKETETKHLN